MILLAALVIAAQPMSHTVYALPSVKQETSPAANNSDDKTKDPHKFKEIVQPIQYDGDYSPLPGRYPEAAPTPTTPVRYLRPYELDLPIIVPPAPRYVTEQPAKNAGSNPTANTQNQNGSQSSGASYITSGETSNPNASTPTDTTVPGPLPSAGSATGSNAAANYGQLPN